MNQKSKLQYSKYRKPTETIVTIPNNCTHSLQHKVAYNMLTHRMLKILLSQTE